MSNLTGVCANGKRPGQAHGLAVSSEVSKYGAEMVDAVLTHAMALTGIPHGLRSNGSFVRARLQNTSFDGVSGQVQVGDNTAVRYGLSRGSFVGLQSVVWSGQVWCVRARGLTRAPHIRLCRPPARPPARAVLPHTPHSSTRSATARTHASPCTTSALGQQAFVALQNCLCTPEIQWQFSQYKGFVIDRETLGVL